MAMACKHGRKKIAELLHQNGKEVKHYTNYEQAFRNSTEHYQYEICRWLLDKDPYLKIDSHFTPILRICKLGDLQFVKLILNHQSKISLDIMNEAFKISHMNGHYMITGLLLLVNKDINVHGVNNELFLQYYNNNDLNNVKKLFRLKKFAITFNMINEAFSKHHLELAIWACENSIDVDLTLSNDIICKKLYTDNNYDELYYVLDRTKHRNINDRYMWACMNNHLLFAKCIRALNLNHDINFRNMILLHTTCEKQFIELREWLYQHATNNTNIVHRNDILLKYACTQQDIELISWILDKRVLHKDKLNLNTIFRSACYSKHFDVLKLLHKYDKNVINCILDDKLYPIDSINVIKGFRTIATASKVVDKTIYNKNVRKIVVYKDVMVTDGSPKVGMANGVSPKVGMANGVSSNLYDTKIYDRDVWHRIATVNQLPIVEPHICEKIIEELLRCDDDDYNKYHEKNMVKQRSRPESSLSPVKKYFKGLLV